MSESDFANTQSANAPMTGDAQVALPSGAPDPIAPLPPPPVDFHEAVREAANALLSPDVLDAAVQAALAKAAPTHPLVAEMAVQAQHVIALYDWAHELFDMFQQHFSGKLPMPVPPPKPGSGIGQ